MTSPDSSACTPQHALGLLLEPFRCGTRKVLAWRLSNRLEAAFCVEAVNEALIRLGSPDIMNTDSHTIGASSRVV